MGCMSNTAIPNAQMSGFLLNKSQYPSDFHLKKSVPPLFHHFSSRSRLSVEVNLGLKFSPSSHPLGWMPPWHGTWECSREFQPKPSWRPLLLRDVSKRKGRKLCWKRCAKEKYPVSIQSEDLPAKGWQEKFRSAGQTYPKKMSVEWLHFTIIMMYYDVTSSRWPVKLIIQLHPQTKVNLEDSFQSIWRYQPDENINTWTSNMKLSIPNILKY